MQVFFSECLSVLGILSSLAQMNCNIATSSSGLDGPTHQFGACLVGVSQGQEHKRVGKQSCDVTRSSPVERDIKHTVHVFFTRRNDHRWHHDCDTRQCLRLGAPAVEKPQKLSTIMVLLSSPLECCKDLDVDLDASTDNKPQVAVVKHEVRRLLHK